MVVLDFAEFRFVQRGDDPPNSSGCRGIDGAIPVSSTERAAQPETMRRPFGRYSACVSNSSGRSSLGAANFFEANGQHPV